MCPLPCGTTQSVLDNSKTTVALSPMVEFGGRITTNDNETLRVFAAIGMSFLPDNTRVIDATFVGASPADGTFPQFDAIAEHAR